MFSDKLESIPSQSWQELETCLNEKQAKGVKYVRKHVVARQTEISEDNVLAMLSELCDEDILAAKVKVYCPSCSRQHGGVYDRQSDVPDEVKHCMCGSEFRMAETTNWQVVYELPSESLDFFLDVGERLQTFSESARSLSQSFFEKNFRELSNLESPQRRGQLFDYFLGLLVQQLEGSVVRCRYNQENPGELDVIANFSEGPAWAIESIGCAMGIENKWEKDPTPWEEIGKFDSKLHDLHERHGSRVGFFVTMSRFTEDAKEEMNDGTPRIIGLREDDVHEMIEDATAENVLRDAVFY